MKESDKSDRAVTMIETENLILRPIEKSDADRMYEVYSNPTVMKYIYDGSTFSR